MREKRKKRERGVPPKRLAPWTPPITSPAAHRPGMDLPYTTYVFVKKIEKKNKKGKKKRRKRKEYIGVKDRGVVEDTEAAHAVVDDRGDESDGKVFAVHIPGNVMEKFLKRKKDIKISQKKKSCKKTAHLSKRILLGQSDFVVLLNGVRQLGRGNVRGLRQSLKTVKRLLRHKVRILRELTYSRSLFIIPRPE